MKQKWYRMVVIFTTFCLIISGCTGGKVDPTVTVLPPTGLSPTAKTVPIIANTAVVVPTVAPTKTAVISPTALPLPEITLKEGNSYFSVDGKPSFLYSRNLAGNTISQYSQLLDLTSTGGSKLARIQLDSFGMGYSNSGKVDEAWAKNWEVVFKKAESNGIYVMPTFSAWYDWNDGEGYSTWKSNPLNEVNGGPARKSRELFVADSPTQKLWLNWMKTLIERWQGQKNIIAWEIFSEVNMSPGSTQSEAVDFVTSAASIIRVADPSHRPITASLADFGNWSGFYRSDAIDFINIHPYPVPGNLDTTIISDVHSMLDKYHKPVLIGESGLSFLTPDSKPPTLTTAPRADIGIRHAIWAAVVSGAMNGRALWWEDGVAIYFPALNLPFIKKYTEAELPASKFVSDVDFTGFQALTSSTSSSVRGAVVGNEKLVVGWFRDAKCEPPDWKLQPVISKQTVTISVPGTGANWRVNFYDTKTGTDIISSAVVTRNGEKIMITLPDFSDDIAFKVIILN
jgi:hypothetical protein